MTQFKLFEQFNKLLDSSTVNIEEDTKKVQKLALKLTKHFKLDGKEDNEQVEEKVDEE